MSLALPETSCRCPPITVASRPARALRHLRWRLTREHDPLAALGSRLRLSMILFCSAVFWVGLFGLFLGGFEFIGLSDELFQRDLRIPVQHVLPVDPDHALLLDRDHHLHGAVPFARGAFLLTTPASTDRIFAYKFAEAVGISSWGFFLLGSPLMAAYGLTVKAPPALLRACSCSTCSRSS